MVIGNYKSPEELYDEGLQKEKECKQDEAFYYFKESADLGLVPAIHKVGYCFLHGDGTDKDEDKALEYLQKSADMNYADSIFQLAVFYYDDSDDNDADELAYVYFFKAMILNS
jgi:uncharacterized protein